MIEADAEAMCNAYGPEAANHKDGANLLFVDNSVAWDNRAPNVPLDADQGPGRTACEQLWAGPMYPPESWV